MARNGLIEGRSFIWIGQPITELSQLEARASDLVRADVDIIITDIREAVLPAKQATKTIPIVMLLVSDAVREGWVNSFSRPGGNVTGMASFPIEMEVKRLQILIETIPRVQRIAYFVFAPFRARPAIAEQIMRLEALAASSGMQLPIYGVGEERGAFDSAMEQAARAGVQGALIHNHATVGVDSLEQVGNLALRLRLPSITSYRGYAAAGLLFTYGEDIVEVYRKGAGRVAKLIAGAKPSDLPIEFPTLFEFVVNLKTAAALGLQIPSSVLLRASELIR